MKPKGLLMRKEPCSQDFFPRTNWRTGNEVDVKPISNFHIVRTFVQVPNFP